MKNHARTVLALLALAACGGATSCKKGTYLELEFTGSTSVPIDHIHIHITVDKPSGGVSSAEGTIPNPPKVVTLPASAAIDMDQFGDALGVSVTAVAFPTMAETNPLAQATAATTIMHGQTWTVTLDFDGVAGMDAGATPDLGGGQDGSLVTITDGSVDAGGCVAATVQASESVSLDYNSSGQDMDSADKLWAYLGPGETYVGWMKFGLRFVPRAAHLTKATLNLFMVQAPTGVMPTLAVDYSPYIGWTRKSAKASDVTIDGTIGGPYLTPNAPPASTQYALDVTNHNWMGDVVAGTITLGIANTTVLGTALTSSKVQFYGVNTAASPDPTRPTLDLEFCQ